MKKAQTTIIDMQGTVPEIQLEMGCKEASGGTECVEAEAIKYITCCSRPQK